MCIIQTNFWLVKGNPEIRILHTLSCKHHWMKWEWVPSKHTQDYTVKKIAMIVQCSKSCSIEYRALSRSSIMCIRCKKSDWTEII